MFACFDIICRFSRDVETIDNNLPFNIKAYLRTLFGALSTCVVITYSTPYFITVLLPLGVLYYFIQVVLPCISGHGLIYSLYSIRVSYYGTQFRLGCFFMSSELLTISRLDTNKCKLSYSSVINICDPICVPCCFVSCFLCVM